MVRYKDFASWPRYNAKPVLLEGDTRLTTYQAGAAGNVPLKLYTSSAGTTDATGMVSFTLPVGFFTVVYGAMAQVVRNTADPTQASFAMVRTWSATTVTVHCFESKTSGVLLGGYTEGLETCGAGLPVTVMVFGT